MIRNLLGLDPASYNEFLQSIAFLVIAILLFILAMNWGAVRRAARAVRDFALAVADAYCRYEEELGKLTPEERAYLKADSDTHLFI